MRIWANWSRRAACGGPVHIRVPGEEIVVTAAEAEGVTWVEEAVKEKRNLPW